MHTQWERGGMNTQGAGTHPGGGAEQPQGTQAYLFPFAQTGAGKGRPIGARYPAPATGICTPGAPNFNTLGYGRWGLGVSILEHAGAGGGARAPRVGESRRLQKHFLTSTMRIELETAPLVEAPLMKPPDLGEEEERSAPRPRQPC